MPSKCAILLASFLQRILRYPLLIKEMLKLMDGESEEHRCLKEALVSIEKVANYINEMQMISETYTPRFEKLCEAVEGVEVRNSVQLREDSLH